MTPSERQRFLDTTIAALSAQVEAMAESRPHNRAKNKALDKLSQHFRLSGRRIYLASELAVLYPDEDAFVPDIMAVLDVEDPGEADERSAWTVADEGKGLDLVIEVFHKGNENKDFVENVETYGRLGITEYFIYDRRRQILKGYRLPSQGARRYREVKSRLGRYPSSVLGLDLSIVEGRLCFFQGGAEIFDSEELISRLGQMVDDLEQRRWEAEERAQREQERAQREQEGAKRLLTQLQQSLLDVLAARGFVVDDETKIRITSCDDGDALRSRIVHAVRAASLADVFV